MNTACAGAPSARSLRTRPSPRARRRSRPRLGAVLGDPERELARRQVVALADVGGQDQDARGRPVPPPGSVQRPRSRRPMVPAAVGPSAKRADVALLEVRGDLLVVGRLANAGASQDHHDVGALRALYPAEPNRLPAVSRSVTRAWRNRPSGNVPLAMAPASRRLPGRGTGCAAGPSRRQSHVIRCAHPAPGETEVHDAPARQRCRIRADRRPEPREIARDVADVPRPLDATFAADRAIDSARGEPERDPQLPPGTLGGSGRSDFRVPEEAAGAVMTEPVTPHASSGPHTSGLLSPLTRVATCPETRTT